MKIKYVGPSHLPREILELGVIVNPGEPVEVPKAVADRLLEQKVWAKAGKG